MKRIIAIAVPIIIAVSAAQARIGETPEQIQTRYGPPRTPVEQISSNHVSQVYLSDGFGVTVDFVAGKSASEIFIKKDATVFGRGEIDGLLGANNAGLEWMAKASGSLEQQWWKRSDDKLGAIYFTDGTPPRLWIFTQDYMRLMKEEKDAKGKQKPGQF